jgi:hypothetical protein
MPCPKCLEKPNYHSFTVFGKLDDTTSLFYTSPAKTEDFNEDGTKLANIATHIQEETEGTPWIWVLDCGNMSWNHYTEVSFNFGLLKLLVESTTLQAIWIVRPNMWIRGVHSLLQFLSDEPILDTIVYIEGDTIEQKKQYQQIGVEPHSIDWILSQ